MKLLNIEDQDIADILFYKFWKWQYYKRSNKTNYEIFSFNSIEEKYDPEARQILKDLAEGISHDYFEFGYLSLPQDICYVTENGDGYYCIKIKKGAPTKFLKAIISLTNFRMNNIDSSGEIILSNNDTRRNYFRLKDEVDRCKIQNLSPSYLTSSETSRAVGLWLWDRVKELCSKRGAKIQAIKELEQLPYFEKLGLGYDPDYYHFLRRTEACIEAAEVLAFDKKNPERKKYKSSSGTRKRKLVPGTKTVK